MEHTSKRSLVFDLASDALQDFALAQAASLTAHTYDSGPAVLARLTNDFVGGDAKHVCEGALGTWLDKFPAAAVSPSLFGGLASLFAGAYVALPICGKLTPLLTQLRETLTAGSDGIWRSENIEWSDYDLISGPSGTLLALLNDGACSVDSALPIASHLAALCDSNDLARLRVAGYSDDELRGWNFGRINTGVAHGLAGIAAALCSVCRIDEVDSLTLRPVLRRLCEFLVNESYVDDRGLRTWLPAARENGSRPVGATRRQAWCYGTPGSAWILWECGRVLGQHDLCDFAENAMQSYCKAFDENFYIDDGPVEDALGICHGAAGMLAIADAFAVHANLQPARALAEHLENYLLARPVEIGQLARENMTLLTGASGVIAVLLVRQGGNRDWLSQIALR